MEDQNNPVAPQQPQYQAPQQPQYQAPQQPQYQAPQQPQYQQPQYQQPQYQQPQYPQYHQPYQAAPKRGNGPGVTSFVLSCIATILCWFPFVNIVALVFCIIGLICGIVGLKRIPKWSAVAGLIISIIFLIISIIMIIVYWDVMFVASYLW